ncbi:MULTISPECIES: PSP1 domain-containing protein [Caloramator]|uniref:Cell fate regulator YaaT, PSP1 superfamily (Controls sporulation, competence, biofilm development) n=1 Tax=Caloramator proteoclasticus DSM 10124 TaxID=1121262 RepID=A0A1M4ZRI6_9CLOT|nr:MULTISPECIES: stage 0 sporulation family protein [Caloramator]SHF20614.1 Cell fate regulator YaaT, PSP1 superfamily (controls sporulation, competence, biofilm development) [Caloramator proteoclasticus DSM 10124]
MVTVVGIRFKRAGKIYYFDPDGLDINKGDYAIVETARGIEFGEVVIGKKEVTEDEIVAPLKKVIRVATEEDKLKNLQNKAKEEDAFQICLKKIQEHGLPMKLIDVEYTFDNNKVIFYFVADGRIDFRELVKDLAAIFRTRIELRQIGVRDESKMVGGLGPCGRPMCCATFLGEFEPVSIKMAKEQNLSLNPSKISGVCGRLMCCLNYEQQTYEEIRKITPVVGSIVKTPDGEGEVMENSIIRESVKVKLKTPDDVEIKTYSVHNIELIEGQYEHREISDDEIKSEIEELEESDVDINSLLEE